MDHYQTTIRRAVSLRDVSPLRTLFALTVTYNVIGESSGNGRDRTAFSDAATKRYAHNVSIFDVLRRQRLLEQLSLVRHLFLVPTGTVRCRARYRRRASFDGIICRRVAVRLLHEGTSLRCEGRRNAVRQKRFKNNGEASSPHRNLSYSGLRLTVLLISQHLWLAAVPRPIPFEEEIGWPLVVAVPPSNVAHTIVS